MTDISKITIEDLVSIGFVAGDKHRNAYQDSVWCVETNDEFAKEDDESEILSFLFYGPDYNLFSAVYERYAMLVPKYSMSGKKETTEVCSNSLCFDKRYDEKAVYTIDDLISMLKKSKATDDIIAKAEKIRNL